MTQPTDRPDGQRDDQDEAQLVARDVDRNPGAGTATEADEEAVLGELYGPPDQHGIYRGAGA